MRKEDAVREIARAAVSVERSCGIPAELVAGICALESGWLRHAPGNNPFGIKYSPRRHSGKQLLVTREWLLPEDVEAWTRRTPGRQVLEQEAGPDSRGRRLYKVRDWFAVFPSLEAAMDDLARLFTSKRYSVPISSYHQHSDLKRLFNEIAEAGYSTTSPESYAARVMAVLGSGLADAVKQERENLTGGGDVLVT